MDRYILDSYIINCNNNDIKPNLDNLKKYKLDEKLIEEVEKQIKKGRC